MYNPSHEVRGDDSAYVSVTPWIGYDAGGSLEDTVKILAIAPYEGLASVLEREARTYPNVSMTVAVGNLEDGVTTAIEHLVEPYDLILSRGGTADLLRNNLDFPIVDIKTSPFDVLQALQLCEGIEGRKAVVGFSGITDAARSTKDVLGLDLDIFTLIDEQDAHNVASLLTERGYQTVLCDVISSSVFRARGLNTILITSGSASVRESIDEAVSIVNHLRDARTEILTLREIIRNAAGDTVVIHADGRLYFTTLDKGGNERTLAMLRDLLPEVLAHQADTIRRSLDGYQYVIRAFVSHHGNDALVTFYLSRNRMPSGPRQSGIAFFTKDEANHDYLENVYSLTGEINNIRHTIEDVTRAGKPLLITGEYGTGRTSVAEYAYVNSPRAAHPLIEIDCGMLTDRSRDFLLNSRNAPLFASDLTLHIKNMETSPAAFINELFSTIANTNVMRRCALIFSCNPRGEQVSGYISYIKDKFQCVEVELTPLHENRERIPNIARLYLSQLNADLPKEVLRIDRQAMDLLTEYAWPGNYIQFKRVLSQLCIISHDHTIRASDVRGLLALERPVYRKGEQGGSSYDAFDLDRSLDDIEHDIVAAVVRRNGGNQSAAARQLGISRTTLWRMSKDLNDHN